ncbi:RING finger protein 150a isoform X1 [Chiloscyllium plagiosum]|uniref:RING finger protein 150a isoform X1 n=1 Tax=Chiloscyllium plagiosum TaxID=36176 RepID=UPI001CB7EE1D|nr:RING finger protein 150a isoform X1 [Chiloscyllium plagiosum]
MPVSLVQTCRSLALSTWLLSFCFVHLLCLDFTVAEKEEWYTAFVNITYVEPATSERRSEKSECGRYGQHSLKQDARGLLALPAQHDKLACDPQARFQLPPDSSTKGWIALIPKGNCTFKDKILHAARQNASAVVIYNMGANVNETITMPHSGAGDIVAIMIPELKGREIMSLIERNITIMMYITIGTRNLQKYVSRTSVVFVSISFIVLMIISLAWLVFYYIQRFRYANARDRNQRRLGDAAKKAIGKLQIRTIKKGDKETESDFDNCAVCIEGYKPNDVVRILPCRHLFHKTCVDPWLLDHRTCPMCKMNILKALGIPPNADCADDITTDFDGSIGGPPTNQITGASDVTVNESSVGLDPPVRTIGLSQIIHDDDILQQVEEVNITTSNSLEGLDGYEHCEWRVLRRMEETPQNLSSPSYISHTPLETDQEEEGWSLWGNEEVVTLNYLGETIR